MTDLSWPDVFAGCNRIAAEFEGRVENVFPILRGGSVPAVIVAEKLGVPVTSEPPTARTLIVDDIVDTGATMRRFLDVGYARVALVAKGGHEGVSSPIEFDPGKWVTFPWETADAAPATDNVVRLLEAIGEDPTRPGLLETPARVVKALREMTSGNEVDVAGLLSRTFDEPSGDTVALHGIEFTSLCEHHLLPFSGTASIMYVPDRHVVGLSKLARLVGAYAERLQVQERMTTEIAEALEAAPGLATSLMVAVSGTHSCMVCRGVKKTATMQTTVSRGVPLAPSIIDDFLAGHRAHHAEA